MTPNASKRNTMSADIVSQDTTKIAKAPMQIRGRPRLTVLGADDYGTLRARADVFEFLLRSGLTLQDFSAISGVSHDVVQLDLRVGAGLPLWRVFLYRMVVSALVTEHEEPVFLNLGRVRNSYREAESAAALLKEKGIRLFPRERRNNERPSNTLLRVLLIVPKKADEVAFKQRRPSDLDLAIHDSLMSVKRELTAACSSPGTIRGALARYFRSVSSQVLKNRIRRPLLRRFHRHAHVMAASRSEESLNLRSAYGLLGPGGSLRSILRWTTIQRQWLRQCAALYFVVFRTRRNLVARRYGGELRRHYSSPLSPAERVLLRLIGEQYGSALPRPVDR